ncbi:MAG TPA: 5-formyltetrahydrofolate cyclo-ligase [Candidatus Merdenecus merdavium]|nr:5-formyltetrahydrofolate cyclo-ligase [Candidatus Merdenecus merdavium]
MEDKIANLKEQCREKIKLKQKSLEIQEMRESDTAIALKVSSLKEFSQAKVIFIFVSTKEEINTAPMIEKAWELGKRVVVPKCMDKGRMEAYEIQSFLDLEEGFWGILEPKDNSLLISPHEIDLAIIPCLSCDRKLNRLGKGGGYYDRYLEHASFVKAALCRESLLLHKVPVDVWDQKVDMVITEKEIYKSE